MRTPWADRLVASPACNPKWPAREAFRAYGKLGFKKLEVFTSWAASHFRIGSDPGPYRHLIEACGLEVSSFHLPEIDPDSDEAWVSLMRAADAARVLGASVVLYKAKTIDDYVRAAPRALDLLEERGLIGVLQNHKGSALSSLEDTQITLERIDDPRMKVLLEVGHLHAAGCPWERAYPKFKDRIALVHVKDIGEGRSVPYGEGEVDLPGLFSTLDREGYEGNAVVEIEIREVPETDRYLEQALEYLRKHCLGS